MKRIVFWDVDTQKDFMDKDGALYVPSAETIKPNLKKLTEYALANNITILGSIDTHHWEEVYNEDGTRNYAQERELNKKINPQYEAEVNEFASEDESGLRLPVHCKKGTEGHKKIEETLGGYTIYIPSKPHNEILAYDLVYNPMVMTLRGQEQVYLEKHTFTPSQNPNFERILEIYDAQKIILYGVVSGICVRAAAEALYNWCLEIVVVEDAIMDLGEEDKKLAYETFEKINAKLVSTKDIITGNY